MSKAARAIIIEDGKILVMHRDKQGSKYFTLVGGRVNDNETTEQALVREVMEETGLNVTSARLVFMESHPAPYNDQYIYLCEIAPHSNIAIQDYSEEAHMNRMQANLHEPQWCTVQAFPNLQFRTPQLHAAINQAVKKGFPKEPIQI